MSHSELTDVPPIDEGGGGLFDQIARNEVRVTTASPQSWRMPASNPSSDGAIGVVVICLPAERDCCGEAMAHKLAAGLRGMDCAEIVRALTQQRDAREVRGTLPDDSRTLLTVLFTDIVESTQLVERLGDRAWRALLARHNAIVRTQLAGFQGREAEHTGDGFLATFDRPTRAVRCAQRIRTELRAIGIAIRVAVHTAECETGGEHISGTAVHVAARMVSSAAPGEIVVSSTVRELVAGSGLAFSQGKWHALRGLSGRRRLFALEQ